MKYIIDKIEKLEIKDKDSDVIVMTFDPDQINFCDAVDCFSAIEDALPKHNTIGVVKGLDLSVESIDELINKLQALKEKKQNEDIH